MNKIIILLMSASFISPVNGATKKSRMLQDICKIRVQFDKCIYKVSSMLKAYSCGSAYDKNLKKIQSKYEVRYKEDFYPNNGTIGYYIRPKNSKQAPFTPEDYLFVDNAFYNNCKRIEDSVESLKGILKADVDQVRQCQFKFNTSMMYLQGCIKFKRSKKYFQ
ncbi:MAG: hypothetical protein ACR2M7_02930 [Bdellovibrionales bacterium]